MKPSSFLARFAAAATMAAGLGLRPAVAQTVPQSDWLYTLVEGSLLLDDCPICDRISIPRPMRGTFHLRLLQEGPLFTRYELTNISLTADAPGRQYRVSGHGTYQVGGEVAVLQDLTLEAQIDSGVTNQPCYFTNAVRAVSRGWPMLEVSVDDSNGTPAQTYRLTLVAAPLREIWFSTTYGFHPAAGQPPGTVVSDGDLLSSAGRIVKRNQDLVSRLGIMPVVPDLGLDAVDVLPGGEIGFSVRDGQFSETLGPLSPGDVLSDRGRVVRRYADLLVAFGPQPPTPEVGLDALQVLDSGEVLFSIQTNLFSETLGLTLQRGDLLSSEGRVVRTQAELLARFHPPKTNEDYGLDAVYVWPSGEIWFSTEQGFQDQLLGPIVPGDLLSDQGSIVFRNLELVSPFAPLEDLADFGLDALYVVTDALPPAPAPRITAVARDPNTGALALSWEGKGRTFQLERADDVPGPYLPLGPIATDGAYEDADAGRNRGPFFYRLRQW